MIDFLVGVFFYRARTSLGARWMDLTESSCSRRAPLSAVEVVRKGFRVATRARGEGVDDVVSRSAKERPVPNAERQLPDCWVHTFLALDGWISLSIKRNTML